MKSFMKFISIFLVFIILIVGQGNNVQANSVVTQWNTLVLDAVKAARTPPTITARILYIVHQSIYDAWSVYDNVALTSRYGDQLRRPSSERTLDNKNKAVSYAAFTAFNDLYPQFLANSTALMTSLGYNPIETTKSFTTASGIGITVAYSVIQFRHGDGSNQLGDLNPGNYTDCTNYVPTNTPSQINDPNLWQPLLVNNNTQRYTTPHWYTIQTFANEVWPNITAAPYKYPSDGYTKQAEEVLSYYANLTDLRKCVAEYWAGGPGTVTPPGIWNQYAQYVSNRDSYDIDKDAKLFFLLNAALMDASIVCWGVKRYYNSIRPISAIRFLYNGKTIRSWVPTGEVKDIPGETWLPFQESNFVTPAFPSFTSGHSTFSGAAAQILRQFTGSDNFGLSYTFKARTSIIEPTCPAQDTILTYPTFTDAANDAGISRLYGGIHFQLDNINGLYAGKVVAQNVLNKGLRLINGTSFLIPQTPSPSPSSSSTFTMSFFLLFIIQIIFLVLKF